MASIEKDSSSGNLITSPSDSSSSRVEEKIVDKRYPTNDVIFVGKGNPAPSRYIIIPKSLENEVQTFADGFLFRGLEQTGAEPIENDAGFFPTPPGVLISVTGGAQDFYMHSSKIEQVFNRGMLKAAQNIGAWIVDGGLDAGVMQYVGKAIKEMAVDDVPCIGIASHKMVVLNEMLTEKGNTNIPAEYVASQPNTPTKCALNPNHTHFILVDSPVAQWGHEIMFRSELEKYIREKFQIPVVLIVVNGGPGTLETVASGAEKNFAIVVVQGSGRASDAVAALVKKAQIANAAFVQTCDSLMAIRDDGVDITPWTRLLAEAKGDKNKIGQWTAFMDRILQNYSAITIFNADDEASADMDIFILRAILSSPGRRLTLKEKLRLGVVWNREDIVSEILDTEKDMDLSSEDKRAALNSAFELSIIHNRPGIFTILADKGAQKDSVNLQKLYYYKPVKSYFRRLPAYAQTRSIIGRANKLPENRLPLPLEEGENNGSEFSQDSPKKRQFLKEAFRQIGGALHGYHAAFEQKFESNSDETSNINNTATMRRRKKKMNYREAGTLVAYTDFLIWSVFVNRLDLAKAIWRRTTLPVHSALIASQMYRYLSRHCTDKEGYLENADWFEGEAIKMMDILEYSDIKDVLVWEWYEMGNKSAVEIAQDAECKRFVCHAHVQALLDDKFFSDQFGKVEPTTSAYRIWASILVPPLSYFIYKYYDTTPRHFWMFYRLPIVKFWTNTFFYLAFLFVQAYVLCTLRAGDDYHAAEIVLWIWVFSLIVDEVAQYIKDPENHFSHLSNFIDVLVLLLHLVYMILRWISHETESPAEENAGSGSASESFDPTSDEKFMGSVNVLIVACVFSWARLLNAFAISHSLGPLYFIMIRLFKDIFLWLFVFAIFAISFQLGFINITMQAQEKPLSGYPAGTFPVSFFTIIGDYNYANDIMDKAPFGIALLAIYALLAQIMLVNLLIAMMGDTYSNVSENSATEWKFYRLALMMENQSTSFHPPPTNIIVVPLQFLFRYRQCATKQPQGAPEENVKAPLVRDNSNVSGQSETLSSYDLQRVLKKMRIARDEVIDQERLEDSTSVGSIVTGLQERLRTLANERENDRTFLEKKFKELEGTLQAAATHAASTGSPSGVAGLALGGVQDTIQGLQQSNQLLVQQNQQILSLLQQQQQQQIALQQQIINLQQQVAPHSQSLAPQVGESSRGRSASSSDGRRTSRAPPPGGDVIVVTPPDGDQQ